MNIAHDFPGYPESGEAPPPGTKARCGIIMPKEVKLIPDASEGKCYTCVALLRRSNEAAQRVRQRFGKEQ